MSRKQKQNRTKLSLIVFHGRQQADIKKVRTKLIEIFLFYHNIIQQQQQKMIDPFSLTRQKKINK